MEQQQFSQSIVKAGQYDKAKACLQVLSTLHHTHVPKKLQQQLQYSVWSPKLHKAPATCLMIAARPVYALVTRTPHSSLSWRFLSRHDTPHTFLRFTRLVPAA
jgi:hypothetical protein